jgi:hypothetical protein
MDHSHKIIFSSLPIIYWCTMYLITSLQHRNTKINSWFKQLDRTFKFALII